MKEAMQRLGTIRKETNNRNVKRPSLSFADQIYRVVYVEGKWQRPILGRSSRCAILHFTCLVSKNSNVLLCLVWLKAGILISVAS